MAGFGSAASVEVCLWGGGSFKKRIEQKGHRFDKI